MKIKEFYDWLTVTQYKSYTSKSFEDSNNGGLLDEVVVSTRDIDHHYMTLEYKVKITF